MSSLTLVNRPGWSAPGVILVIGGGVIGLGALTTLALAAGLFGKPAQEGVIGFFQGKYNQILVEHHALTYGLVGFAVLATGTGTYVLIRVYRQYRKEALRPAASSAPATTQTPTATSSAKPSAPQKTAHPISHPPETASGGVETLFGDDGSGVGAYLPPRAPPPEFVVISKILSDKGRIILPQRSQSTQR